MMLHPRRQSAAGTWNCPSCGIDVPVLSKMCNICQRGRPMSRENVQQIFSGRVFHFNGVIPRTLKHPSHAVEWRMAERYGATVTEDFDMQKVTHLIYRPGYERSEKVRRAVAVRKEIDIHAVPINWMLDSLLQSRPIHESMVRLNAIPDQATHSATKGNALPHHSHPFYVACSEDYQIFSLEEREEQRQKQLGAGASASAGSSGGAGGSGGGAEGGRGDPIPGAPPFPSCVAPPLRFTAASVPLNKHLFNGMCLVFTAGCYAASTAGAIAVGGSTEENLAQAALRRGARVVLPPEEQIEIGNDFSGVTHVVFAHNDRKCALLIDALPEALNGNLIIVTQQWFEDCQRMNERLPELGPYIASSKTVSTLEKKRSKIALK